MQNGIINPGDKNCRHSMQVVNTSYWKDGENIRRPEIGKCTKCGREINYTVMQQRTITGYQRCAMDRPDSLTNGCTLERITKTRTGNTAAIKERRGKR